MAREIKFRAIEYGLEDKENYGERWIYTEDNGRPYFGDCIFDSAEKHIINQYTGLKDKNGKEIYEGDVLLYPDTYTESVDVGLSVSMPVEQQQYNSFFTVEFQDGQFGMNVKDSELLGTCWISLYGVIDEAGWVEVIGNIYENPDLIK